MEAGFIYRMENGKELVNCKLDCTTCGHGAYNDHWNRLFCYCPHSCCDFDQWTPKQGERNDKLKTVPIL